MSASTDNMSKWSGLPWGSGDLSEGSKLKDVLQQCIICSTFNQFLSSSHGQRSLVGYSPWDHEELDTTEWLHFHFSLSCIGEGNGNPLQCSCLENPRDRRAWWAAVYGVAQSQTWLKWLSSSTSSLSEVLNQVCRKKYFL